MDWPLLIMVVIGGSVCAGFGWIYSNTLAQRRQAPEDGSPEVRSAP
jgi:hypothetical protein